MTLLDFTSRIEAPLQILKDQVAQFVVSFIALVPNLVAAVLLILATWIAVAVLSRLFAQMLRRSPMRASLQRALVVLFRISLWIVGLLIAAAVVFPNLTPTKLLAGLGLGSIAIGLAFKDIFENFLSGILILLRKPMQIGDDIEAELITGRVEAITVRDTYLRKRSGELVVVPNSFLFKNPIKILTDQPVRRISLAVGVDYAADLKQAHAVLAGAFEGLSTVDRDRPVDVFVTTFNDSSIDFLLRWWSGATPTEEHRSRNEVAMAVKAALDAAGLEIPFPQRTLSFAEPVPLAGAPEDSRPA